jgi:acetoin utilization protein AcuB
MPHVDEDALSQRGRAELSDAPLGGFRRSGALAREMQPRSAMTVQDILRRNVVTAAPGDRLADAGVMMRIARLRHLPIVRDGIVVGVLSYRDLSDAYLDAAKSIAASALLQTTVSELVQRAPVTIGPECSVTEAAERMLALRVGCLLVATPTRDGPRLLGVVTEADLLRAAYLV